MTHSIALLTASPIINTFPPSYLYYNVARALAMSTENFHKAWPSKQYGGNLDDYQEYETDNSKNPQDQQLNQGKWSINFRPYLSSKSVHVSTTDISRASSKNQQIRRNPRHCRHPNELFKNYWTTEDCARKTDAIKTYSRRLCQRNKHKIDKMTKPWPITWSQHIRRHRDDQYRTISQHFDESQRIRRVDNAIYILNKHHQLQQEQASTPTYAPTTKESNTEFAYSGADHELATMKKIFTP